MKHVYANVFMRTSLCILAVALFTSTAVAEPIANDARPAPEILESRVIENAAMEKSIYYGKVKGVGEVEIRINCTTQPRINGKRVRIEGTEEFLEGTTIVLNHRLLVSLSTKGAEEEFVLMAPTASRELCTLHVQNLPVPSTS